MALRGGVASHAMTNNMMSDTLDEYVSDETRKHREWLSARDQLVRAVDCPRCGQIAMTPCVGTDDDERHAREFLAFHHVLRDC